MAVYDIPNFSTDAYGCRPGSTLLWGDPLMDILCKDRYSIHDKAILE
jgi:hypothetical protein